MKHTQIAAHQRLSTDKPLSLAILAMGGQGGGVLADWIVAVAERSGWIAQSTSVPGVAQRTGATIYYIEMLPEKDGAQPVLSLMPSPGDVDIVLAAELMEAGRSVLRGLVTPDKTTLIASTHRSFAIGEKEKPGDGIGNPETVTQATDFAARNTIAFDMDTLAVKNGSVISASMFGALAASGTLPFERSAYEETIKEGGKGVSASLKAFDAAFERTKIKPRDSVSNEPFKRLDPLPGITGNVVLDALVARIAAFPEIAHAMLFAGVKKLTDFQDPAYADEYLDHMSEILSRDQKNGGEAKGYPFTVQAAKYLAVAMAYDDVVRVADLKVRASRFERVRREVGAKDGQILYMTEYMHPRMEEICGTMPRRMGEWIENRPKLFARLDKIVNKGRRVRTGTLFWFFGLYAMSSLRRIRRKTLRHAREMEHLQAWLDAAKATLPVNYDLAVELLGNRRLVKGYSDTHSRGLSKFDRVMSVLPQLRQREDGADWMRRLRQAALADEKGELLDGAIKTIATL
ncbi:indolepyruvate oxidoreductase [Limoniibacter endophyticus]|uniref:Indolepyruvate oxidoreductase n=1 Tax=Limoniibacter endophyticus TaxID=1565040 RepID=A0A8J3DMX2_9HYPH|nr:indolepyruvate oxidoreductase subunit beta family protein [Limoniibacter endophyticus]GHC72210.1 indolepyruvate oxidoreductase [Limoniibacter endophyticus]